MMYYEMKYLLLLLILCIKKYFICPSLGHKHYQRIKLKDIKTITFYENQWSNARRKSPIPHLNCIGDKTLCQNFAPLVVQCYNQGENGFTTQWECKANLEKGIRFGKVEVNCEGYEDPDDNYILKDSCGLEYTLERKSKIIEPSLKIEENNWSAVHTIWLLVFLCLLYFLYTNCLHSDTNHPVHLQQSPDIGFRSEYLPTGVYSNYSSAYNQSSTFNNFWTGIATGGLLGYVFGNRRSSSNHLHRKPSPPETWWSKGDKESDVTFATTKKR